MKVYFDVGAHDGRDGFGSLIDAKYFAVSNTKLGSLRLPRFGMGAK